MHRRERDGESPISQRERTPTVCSRVTQTCHEHDGVLRARRNYTMLCKEGARSINLAFCAEQIASTCDVNCIVAFLEWSRDTLISIDEGRIGGVRADEGMLFSVGLVFPCGQVGACVAFSLAFLPTDDSAPRPRRSFISAPSDGADNFGLFFSGISLTIIESQYCLRFSNQPISQNSLSLSLSHFVLLRKSRRERCAVSKKCFLQFSRSLPKVYMYPRTRVL